MLRAYVLKMSFRFIKIDIFSYYLVFIKIKLNITYIQLIFTHKTFECDKMLFGSLWANCNHIFRLFGFVGTETNSLFGLFVHCGTTHHLYTMISNKFEEKWWNLLQQHCFIGVINLFTGEWRHTFMWPAPIQKCRFWRGFKNLNFNIDFYW